jgi:hypothetical protein
MASVDEILKGKYPAKANAKKVADWIVDKGGKPDGIIYLESQKLKYNEVPAASRRPIRWLILMF